MPTEGAQHSLVDGVLQHGAARRRQTGCGRRAAHTADAIQYVVHGRLICGGEILRCVWPAVKMKSESHGQDVEGKEGKSRAPWQIEWAIKILPGRKSETVRSNMNADDPVSA